MIEYAYKYTSSSSSMPIDYGMVLRMHNYKFAHNI